MFHIRIVINCVKNSRISIYLLVNPRLAIKYPEMHDTNSVLWSFRISHNALWTFFCSMSLTYDIILYYLHLNTFITIFTEEILKKDWNLLCLDSPIERFLPLHCSFLIEITYVNRVRTKTLPRWDKGASHGQIYFGLNYIVCTTLSYLDLK